MATVKLKNPKGGVQTFEFGHAQRIIKLQTDRDYPKTKCWTLVKDKPQKTEKLDDTNSPANTESSKDAKGTGASGG